MRSYVPVDFIAAWYQFACGIDHKVLQRIFSKYAMSAGLCVIRYFENLVSLYVYLVSEGFGRKEVEIRRHIHQMLYTVCAGFQITRRLSGRVQKR